MHSPHDTSCQMGSINLQPSPPRRPKLSTAKVASLYLCSSHWVYCRSKLKRFLPGLDLDFVFAFGRNSHVRLWGSIDVLDCFVIVCGEIWRRSPTKVYPDISEAPMFPQNEMRNSTGRVYEHDWLSDAISISYVCEGIMPKRLERKSRIILLLILWIAPGKDAVMARKVVFQIYVKALS